MSAGLYKGQSFILGPNTVFEINAFGSIGKVGDAGSGSTLGTPFDFNQAIINLNNGGVFAGDSAVTNAIVNVGAGSSIQGSGSFNPFEVQTDATLDVSGGVHQPEIQVYQDGILNVTGGQFQDEVVVYTGGTASFSGGTLDTGARFLSGADVTLSGGDFRLNGTAIASLPTGLSSGQTLTGTFSDGTVFVLSDRLGDTIDAGTLTLIDTGLAAPNTTPQTLSTGTGPVSLRPGQTLTLDGDARIESGFRATSGTLNLQGGTLDQGAIFVDSLLNVTTGDHAGSLTALANSTINFSGGTFASSVNVFDGSTLNVSGGEAARFITIGDGGEANISDGYVGRRFRARDGSVVNFTGGNIGESFSAESGSTVSFTGGDFMLDGVAITDLDGGLPSDSIFSGTLADGSVFIFSTERASISSTESDTIAANTVTLIDSGLAAADTTPINTATGQGPKGLRAGQTLTLSGTGSLNPGFAAVDATLNVSGGTVGKEAEALGSNVNVTGGEVGRDFAAHRGTTVNLSGGSIGGGLSAMDGSVVNMSGGELGGGFIANAGSEVTISGGRIGGNGFQTQTGSDLTIVGANFQINGNAITEFPTNITSSEVFTGVLADGSVVIFNFSMGYFFRDDTVSLETVAVAPANLSPQTINSGQGPNGLRAGQSLTVDGTAELPDFFRAVSAELNIQGGTVGQDLVTYQSDVNISGGVVGSRLFMNGGDLIISGGVIGGTDDIRADNVLITGGTIDSFLLEDEANLVMTGGQIAENGFFINSGGTADIRGGEIVDYNGFGGTTTISGGDFSGEFTALFGADVHLEVLSLLIDGQSVFAENEEEPILITQRDGALLEAVLLDGSAFSIQLNATTSLPDQDLFSADSTLTVTVVPEPTSFVLLLTAGSLIGLRRPRKREQRL